MSDNWQEFRNPAVFGVARLSKVFDSNSRIYQPGPRSHVQPKPKSLDTISTSRGQITSHPPTSRLTSVRPQIIRRPIAKSEAATPQDVPPLNRREPAKTTRQTKTVAPTVVETCTEVMRVLFVPAAAVAVICGLLVVAFGKNFQPESKRLDLVQIELDDPALQKKDGEMFANSASAAQEDGSILNSIHVSLSTALAEISRPKAEPPSRSAAHDIDDLRSKVKFIAGLIAMHRPSIPNCGEVAKAIVEIGTRENIDPFFVAAVISIESRFANTAVSKVGARGLMQLMPETAAFVAKSRGRSLVSLNDTKTNISLGVRYLKQLKARYRGDQTLVLSAYNWGPGNVDKVRKGAGKIPGSVRSYASTVIQRTQNWSQHYRKAKESASSLDNFMVAER